MTQGSVGQILAVFLAVDYYSVSHSEQYHMRKSLALAEVCAPPSASPSVL